MSGLKVFAPASVANVACGYDVLGFALEQPGDEIIIRKKDTKGFVISTITGGKLPYDPMKNTAGYTAIKLLEYLEYEGGIEMEIHKKMPFGSGLGSSAASAAAGAMAVNEILGRPLSKSELLPFAVLGEQIADGAYHADNVAPSLLGGMILIRDTPSLDFYKIYIPRGLHIVVIHPHIEILTKDSRGILKDKVEMSKHIAQSSNLAGLILGMQTSNFDLIRNSLTDVIIEPQRAHLIPQFYKVKNAALSEGVLGCSISGAGPSIFAICDNSLIAENAANAMQRVFSDSKIESTIFHSKINKEGAILC
ncbi:homoserine kinase [Portibacter marinus]|uniref:homoserine kinase n=1 Tax=Portibacter marinus TaxID=2898660 RepID=UPI001F378EBF|nr:homoserine kinase [Portibacter marinus]